MIKAFVLGAAGAAMALALLVAGFVAGKPQAANAESAQQAVTVAETPLDRKQVETIVREYLLSNPEIMLEVQQALETKQREEQRVAHLQVIKDAKDEIFNAAYDGVVGNPNGKVTIVEFYDYNCGYCKRAQEDMQLLTAADPELRFVLKEFPILGPDLQKAHTVSMAFRALAPEKYGEFHNALIGGAGRASEESAVKLAVSLGVDEAALREEMKNPDIAKAFEATFELANRLAITGTPSYVVGNEVVFGALGKELLSEKIAAAKTCIDAATC